MSRREPFVYIESIEGCFCHSNERRAVAGLCDIRWRASDTQFDVSWFCYKIMFNCDSESDCCPAMLRNRRGIQDQTTITSSYKHQIKRPVYTFRQNGTSIWRKSFNGNPSDKSVCFQTLLQFRLNLVSNSVKCLSFRFFFLLSISQNLGNATIAKHFPKTIP